MGGLEMRENKIRTGVLPEVLSVCLIIGMLTGCSGAGSIQGISDSDVISSFGHNASVRSHSMERLSDGQYSAKDIVSVSYKTDDIAGLVS